MAKYIPYDDNQNLMVVINFQEKAKGLAFCMVRSLNSFFLDRMKTTLKTRSYLPNIEKTRIFSIKTTLFKLIR